MAWYMIWWFDICLQQLGFHSIAVVGRLVKKLEKDSYIQKEKQYTKQYKNRINKIENKLEKEYWKT